jgi:hypothetical protein
LCGLLGAFTTKALAPMLNSLSSFRSATNHFVNVILAGVALLVWVGLLCVGRAQASDHLDTPTVIADPRADIGDVYAWISTDGRQLNLVMTLVGHTFSDKIEYAFHVDSGKRFGQTTATTLIACRFPSASRAECRADDENVVSGDASLLEGLQGRHHGFRVFAGLRDDPFFNNVKGTRAAYNVVFSALRAGTAVDAAGCPSIDQATAQAMLYQWRHTEGGPAANLLAGWTSSSIVISVDLDVVARGGKLLAVWGTTTSAERQIDRAGRPLTANALIGLQSPEDAAFQMKEDYNVATPATSARFVPEVQKGLALYDSFDGQCGNQLLASTKAPPSQRYRALATMLADDRIWINSASRVCTQFFAVELAALAGREALSEDCGGRTPNYDAANIYRSLLVDGTPVGVDDGLHHDERQHSASVFPFLAPPDAPPQSAHDPSAEATRAPAAGY